MKAERHYSNACLDIFEDESRDRLMTVQEIVEQFWKNFEEASTDKDIRQAFKTKEALLELDVKLGDFAETRIEVGNYQQKVKDKYEYLDFLDATQVMDIIEKFKRKYSYIAQV